MSATGQLIAALISGGMEAAEAAGLVARAAVEMTGALTKKSSGAARQQRYRERNKASLTVTPEPQQSVTNRNESVTSDAAQEASQSVTKRNEASQSDGAANPPLTYFLTSEEKNLSEKKESKKERVRKKRDAPLPVDWQPSAHAFVVAADHGVSVPAVEQIFRDYLKSSGKLYADYDAAFYNFLRNQKKFNGHGNGTSNHRADPAAGRATARETQHVATMGRAALLYLQESKSAGQGGNLPGSAGPAGVVDFGKRAENAR